MAATSEYASARTHTHPPARPALHARSALHYNLALKALVIDAFIPQEEVAKVRLMIQFQEWLAGAGWRCRWRWGMCNGASWHAILLTDGTNPPEVDTQPAWRPNDPLQLMRRMTYNSEDNSWSLRSSLKTGPAVLVALPRRPASASAGARAGSAQRRQSTLLQLELDVPERRSLDFSHLQFALDAVTMA